MLKKWYPSFSTYFSLVDVYSADEAFITGTFGAQTFVSEIDKFEIGGGVMGPLTSKIKTYYMAMIKNAD